MPGRYCGIALPILLILSSTAASQPITIDIVRAVLGYDQRTGEPIVTYTMGESSKRIFADYTGKNVGKPMEIRIGGRVITKAVIREPILGGSGQLSGLSIDEGRALAERLLSGATKVEVEVVE